MKESIRLNKSVIFHCLDYINEKKKKCIFLNNDTIFARGKDYRPLSFPRS